jgi:hypothetical protein
VVARASTDFQSLIWVGVSPTGQINIWDELNGSWTETKVATTANANADSSAARTMTVTVSGTSVSVSINGVNTSATTSVTSGTYAGLYTDNSDSQSTRWPMFDSFQVS